MTAKRGIDIAIDQAVWSLGNFALGAVIASTQAPAVYAQFVLLQAGYLISLVASRAISSDAAMISQDLEDGVAARISATGACVAGAVTCAIAGLSLLAFGSEVSALAASLSLGVAIAQDGSRQALLIIGNTRRMLVADAVWTVGFIGAIAAILVLDRASVSLFLAAWGVTAFFSLLVCRQPLGSFKGFFRWLSGARGTATPLLVDNLIGRGAPTLSIFIGGLILNPAGLAIVGLGRLLIAPAQTAFAAAVSFGTSELTRRRPEAQELLLRRLRLLLFAIAAATVLAASLGSPIISSINDGYETSDLLLHTIIWGLTLFAGATIQIERIRARAIGYVGAAAQLQTLTGILTVSCATLGATLAGSEGLILGILTGMCIGAWQWIRLGSKHTKRTEGTVACL